MQFVTSSKRWRSVDFSYNAKLQVRIQTTCKSQFSELNSFPFSMIMLETVSNRARFVQNKQRIAMNDSRKCCVCARLSRCDTQYVSVSIHHLKVLFSSKVMVSNKEENRNRNLFGFCKIRLVLLSDRIVISSNLIWIIFINHLLNFM